MGVKVFYHICALNHVMDIIERQVMMMHVSGLYDACEAIYCCISGDPVLIERVKEYIGSVGNKFIIYVVAPHDTTYERLTLYAMHKLLMPEDFALYIHSKGITKTDPTCKDKIEDWVRMLTYHVTKYHKRCVELLQTGYDAVGCNYHNGNGMYPWHFSGNFWWVRGDYYLSLPKRIGPNYGDPEFYVCSGGAKGFSLHNSGVDHHRTHWKMSNYVDLSKGR
jgi:hypothetical protein